MVGIAVQCVSPLPPATVFPPSALRCLADLPLRCDAVHAILYLCLPCMPSSTLASLACLPLACAALHASLCLALACVPSAALGCRACLLAQPEFFMPLIHSRTSSNLPRLLFFPPFPTPFLSCIGHSAWCVCLNVSLYLSCVCLSPLCLSCMGHSAWKVHDVTLAWIFLFLLILFRKVHDVTLAWKFQFLLMGFPTCTTF